MDICLSASNYHPETWTPSAWSVRTIVESLRLHMVTPAHEIGGRSDSYQDRLAYATASRQWQWSIRSKLIVDHESMLRQGLFAESISQVENQPKGKCLDGNGEKTVESGVEACSGVDQLRLTKHGASIQLRTSDAEKLSVAPPLLIGILRVLQSPIRLALVGFAILFCLLNR
jgi:hypothetical protein